MYENSENLIDIIHLGDPDLERMIMVQLIINKWSLKRGLHSCGSGRKIVVGLGNTAKELQPSIKSTGFIGVYAAKSFSRWTSLHGISYVIRIHCHKTEEKKYYYYYYHYYYYY